MNNLMHGVRERIRVNPHLEVLQVQQLRLQHRPEGKFKCVVLFWCEHPAIGSFGYTARAQSVDECWQQLLDMVESHEFPI